jgi:hypothetical protein
MEKVKLAYNFMIMMTYVLHVGYFLFCDVGLWWLLTMIRKHFMVKIHNDSTHEINLAYLCRMYQFSIKWSVLTRDYDDANVLLQQGDINATVTSRRCD